MQWSFSLTTFGDGPEKSYSIRVWQEPQRPGRGFLRPYAHYTGRTLSGPHRDPKAAVRDLLREILIDL